MKIRYSFTIILTLLFLSNFPLFADVYTVSNNSVLDADYPTIALAMSAAQNPGDTIYIHGTGTSYGNIIVTKQLHFIGPGYLLDQSQNEEYNTDASPAILNTVTFNAGSSGSIIEGFYIDGRVVITEDDLHIRKNIISYAFNNGFGAFDFTSSIDSCSIYNNLIHRRYVNSPLLRINSGVQLDNIFLVNNIVSGSINLSGTHDILLVNNTFTDGSGTTKLNDGNYWNNIFCGSIDINSSGTFNQNIFSGTLPTNAPIGQGNEGGINMNTVFTTYVTTDSDIINYLDTNFTELPTGSPADTKCGTDHCGATHGPNPHYRTSGIPEIPILYELTSSQVPDLNGNINIIVKAKAY